MRPQSSSACYTMQCRNIPCVSTTLPFADQHCSYPTNRSFERAANGLSRREYILGLVAIGELLTFC